MSSADSEIDRLVDLLARRLDGSLSPMEADELRGLLGKHPDWRADDIDLAAGAAWAATAAEPLPPGLEAKLMATIPASLTVLDGGTEPTRVKPRRDFLAWAIASAAAAVGIVGWWPRLSGRLVERTTPPPAPTLGERRTKLLATAKDAKVLPFAPAGDPLVPKIEGDLVWSSEQQTGYMRFVTGMPKNNVREHEYQLWIFDGTRDERYPVDGGVFDIGAEGELIVEIVPKIRVNQPTLFAVTLEPPGGVVVSSREHILVVAKPS